jgi:hypothetical protein
LGKIRPHAFEELLRHQIAMLKIDLWGTFYLFIFGTVIFWGVFVIIS